MNDQTLKMIEGLAQKLGTTSEYLWAILIKQAPIDSFIGIGYIMLAIGIGLVLRKIHKKLIQQPPKEDGYRQLDSYYEKYDNVPLVVILIVAAAWLICCIVLLRCIGNIFTGLYNPEYWALDKILNSIKPTK